MKRSRYLFSALMGAVVLWAGCSTVQKSGSHEHVVTQASAYDALNHSLFDGVAPLSRMAPLGDLGLGAVDGFDGEVVLLDGKFYVVRGDGHVDRIKDLSVTTPFLEVEFFHGDLRKELPGGTSYAHLQQSPLEVLPSQNIVYAVRLEGVFQRVKTRSMPRQSKPYVPLTTLVKTQPTFEFTNVVGTMVGFWSPPSAKGVALAGWHLHFLTSDLKGGGHVLEFVTEKAVLRMDECHEFHWLIPDSEEFRHTDFTK
jgi:acetolactate decarboxylase